MSVKATLLPKVGVAVSTVFAKRRSETWLGTVALADSVGVGSYWSLPLMVAILVAAKGPLNTAAKVSDALPLLTMLPTVQSPVSAL